MTMTLLNPREADQHARDDSHLPARGRVTDMLAMTLTYPREVA